MIVYVGYLILIVISLLTHFNYISDASIKYKVGERVNITTIISEKVESTGSYYTFDYHGMTIKCSQDKVECKKLGHVRVGGKIEVIGKVNTRVIDNSNKVIRWIDGEFINIQYNEQFVEQFYGKILKYLADFKDIIILLYRSIFPEPHASLLSGVVLGAKNQLTEGFYNNLVKTGTMHVVAASGFNVTIISGVIFSVLIRIFSRKWAISLSCVALFGYAVMAGLDPAIIRATIMGSLALLAQVWGKEYQAKLGWGITGLTLLIFYPWLLDSISFQLSMTATAGILWGQKPLEKLIKRIFLVKKTKNHKNNTGKLQSIFVRGFGNFVEVFVVDLSTTLAAIMATLPITMDNFGQTSLFSPLVNATILWMISPIMIIGLIVGIFFWNPMIARVISWFLWPLLDVFVKALHWWANISGSMLINTQINWWIAIGWWLCLVGWWGGGKRREL